MEDNREQLFKIERVNYSNYIYQPYNVIDEVKTPSDGIPYDFNYRKYNEGIFKLEKLTHTEDDFVNNFTNPLCAVSKIIRTLVIEKKEKNISIKMYYYIKSRNKLRKYFLVRRTLEFITFNYKTKRFYGGVIRKKNKKLINKTFNFNLTNINNSNFKQSILSLLHDIYDSDNIGYGEKTLNKNSEIFNIFFENIAQKCGLVLDKSLSPDKNLFLFYLKLNGIKYPDSFFNYSGLYFKKSDLKPFKMNLVNYVMSLYQLKGDNVRKILNTINNFSMYDINKIYELLGVDYFNKIKNINIFSTNHLINGNFDMYTSHPSNHYSQLTNKEKSNLVNIINCLTYSEQLSTIYDHLDFKEQLKKYDVNVKIKSQTYGEFIHEHENLSKLLISYKTGLIERFYGEESQFIEEPIHIGDETYYPKLLTKTDEYEKESLIQRNCVRTYTEKPYCLIISLRKNDNMSINRVTIEYQFRRNELIRVQTKERFNSEVKKEWDQPIEILDNMVSLFYKQGVIKLPKITKRFVSGITFSANAIFKEEENCEIIRILPVWDNNIGDEFTRYDYLYELDDLP